MIDRLSHYFLTYKEKPFSEEKRECEITHIYDKEEASEVIWRSTEDYNNRFYGDKRDLLKMIESGLK